MIEFFPNPNNAIIESLDFVGSKLWYSCDQPENYKKIKSGNINLYKPNDFDYIFNSDGFRCDEFNLESDIPIVFVGCSQTEGVGLPVTETWAYKLITKIREHTKKNILFWNLAKSGGSIDQIARQLFWFCKKHNVKHVFGSFPGIYRREFGFENKEKKIESLRNYGEWWEWDEWQDKYGEDRDELRRQVFCEKSFAEYQTFRSMMIIDSIQQYKNFTLDVLFWGEDQYYNKELKSFEKFNLFQKYFKNINFIDNNINPELYGYARDFVHPGPEYHNKIVELYWKCVKHYF